MNQNNSKNENEVLYTEWIPVGKFVKIIALCVFVSILSLGIILTALQPIEMSLVGILLGVMSLAIYLFYYNYRGLKVFITKRLLGVDYGAFNHKRILLNMIIDCSVVKAHFRTFGGVGIRLGLDGSWAYNTDFGDAVKLTLKDKRPFVFSTRNPQKICNLLNELSNS
jgi:hypothetical protein